MPPKLLLVEDNHDDALLVQEAFRDAGSKADVIRVDRVSDARAQIERHEFDAVILDLNLLGSTGLQTLLEASRLTNGTPISVHTGRNDVRLARECSDYGARAVVLKATPCGLPMLLTSILDETEEDDLEAEAALIRLADCLEAAV